MWGDVLKSLPVSWCSSTDKAVRIITHFDAQSYERPGFLLKPRLLQMIFAESGWAGADPQTGVLVCLR